MATVRYDPVPTVAPQPTAPTSYQPADTGAFKALSGLGDAATKAADFYNQAAVDDGFNKLQQHGTSLLYGSTTTGEQGQTAPVPGYLSLNGKAALDKRPQVEQSIDGQIDQITNTFATPEQQQAFKTRALAYRNGFFSQVGSHSNSQADVWYGEVNDATVANQINTLTANTKFDPAIFVEGTKNIIQARAQAAERAGAQKGDEVYTAAVAKGKQEATLAQTQALATVDPEKALKFAAQNKDILGSQYDNVYTALRVRATEAAGNRLAQEQLDQYGGNIAVPPVAGGGQPAWMDTYYANIRASESGGNANAKSSTSSATGLYQFITPTWHGLMRAHPNAGLTEDGRTDPKQQEIAVRLFTADNARALTQSRVPITPGNLYMAAFFGPGGAATIYDTPGNTPMEQAVSQQVLSANGWLRGKTVQDVRQWAASRAGKGIDTSAGGMGGAAPYAAPAPGGPVDVGHPDNVLQFPTQVPPPPQDATIAAPLAPGLPQVATTGLASAKASMVQNILDSDEPIEVKQHAIAAVNAMVQAQQIAADQTAAQKKAANDQAMGGYVQQILTPGADLSAMQGKIAIDPNLTPETKLSLGSALAAHLDGTVQGDTAKFGPSYFDVMKRILADPGNPLRISDPTDILQMAAPGPFGEAPKLTLTGAQALITQMAQSNKSPADASVTTAKAGIMNYAKQKMTFSHDPYYPGDRSGFDFKGESIFNGQFIPKFEKAYSDWIAAGKAPFDFLNQETADKLIAGMRSPHDMAVEKLEATSGVDPSTLTAPPTPAGVDSDGWKLVVNSPPMMPDGKASSPDKWAQAVALLAQQPTTARMAQFDAFFGQSGVHAQDVMDVLDIQPHELTPAEKQAAVAAPPPVGTAPLAPKQAATAPQGTPRSASQGTGPTDVGSGYFPPTPILAKPVIPTVTPRTANPAQYPPGTTTVTPPKKPPKPHPSSF